MTTFAEWEELPRPWQAAFRLAWESFVAGSPPVGAVVAAPDGSLIASGRSRRRESTAPPGQLAGSYLAHAELNALATLPQVDHADCVLYTTLESCVLCASATAMSRVGEVRFAGSDPVWRGLDRIAEVNAFAAELWPRVRGPLGGPFGVWAELLVVIEMLERHRAGSAPLAAFAEERPAVVALGRELVASGAAEAMKRDTLEAALEGIWARLEACASGRAPGGNIALGALPRAANQVVVQMHGEAGSGKSLLARAIARPLGAVVLDKDVVMTGLLRSGVPAHEASGAAYELLWALARSLLEQGLSVIVDSPCHWAAIEERGRELAAGLGATYAMIECACDTGIVELRLASRPRLESQPTRRGSSQGAHRPSGERLVVDSSGPIEELAIQAVRYVRARRQEGAGREDPEGFETEDGLEITLRSLEERLLRRDTRRTPDELERLLAPGFVELGFSGRVYDRAAAIAALVAEDPVRRTLEGFEIAQLSPDLVLATYHAVVVAWDEATTRSQRSSIWMHGESGWRLVFHQGMPLGVDI